MRIRTMSSFYPSTSWKFPRLFAVCPPMTSATQESRPSRDKQPVLISDEVEACKLGALLLQVVSCPAELGQSKPGHAAVRRDLA